MKKQLQRVSQLYSNACAHMHVLGISNLKQSTVSHADKIMLAGGVGLIACALQSAALAQDMDTSPIDRIISILLNDMIQGSFGALIMIVAGLVAIISASMGAYRAAMSALVVAVGAFVLRSFVSVFWPDVDLGQSNY